jgi:hypothetical protein
MTNARRVHEQLRGYKDLLAPGVGGLGPGVGSVYGRPMFNS